LLDGGGAEVKALALQPDGKILAAGSVGGRFALVRYNPDGTLDAGFGAGGTVSTAIGLGVRANAIALRGDGRILLAGNRTITTSGSGDSAVLAQYLPDGTLDASFGAGGTILQDGGYSSVNANAVAIQRNGKIVVTGSATVGGSADLAVLRLLPNGALDGGFGSNGARAVSLGNGADAGNAILIDPAGGILAAGSASGLVGVVRLAGDSSTPADLGADGRSDVFWQNSSTTQTVLWQMNGLSIGSAISPATVGDAHWKLVGVGDFDGDGRADLLWQHRDAGSAGTGMVVVWFMNSGVIASAGSPGTVSDPAWRVQGVGDFNGDGKADILWKNTATGQVLIWEMYGLSITAAGSPNTIADLGWVVQGVGDFNGDGSADVLWKHTGTGQTVVWLMNGLGIAGAGSPGTVADLGWQVQGVGDFDGDGKSDVLWRHDVSGTTVIWRMDGVGVASTASPATVIEPGWRIQGVGDYDGDGRADVFWRNLSSGSTYVWLMNGTGIGSAGSPATVADLDWQVQNPK
jgi:uncharacterized delta-60 repeat protein